MEEIREAALAYYEAGTQEERQLAWAFFKTLDVDGDGTVSAYELVNFLRGSGYRSFDNSSLFQALDRDGNGCLDFYEVLTLYYIIKIERPFCQGCRVFLTGLFFTCLNCFESGTNTFDLCSACYRGKRFIHPHAAILDNYALLKYKRLMNMGRLGQPNMSQLMSMGGPRQPNMSQLMTMGGPGQPNMSQMTSVGSASLKREQSTHVKVKEAFEALDAAVNLVNTCNTM